MINTGFCWSFYKSIAIITLALFTPPALNAQEQSGSAAQEIDQGAFMEGQRLLKSPPLNELSQHVAEGWGARIRDTKLGKPLIGVDCSEEQIVDYMEHHGFVHQYTKITPEPRDHALVGPYNKTMSFSTRRKNWFYRWLFGEYAVGSRFIMLDDAILRITGAAHK